MTTVLVLAALVGNSSKSDALLDHAFEQWKTTPEMRIEDAYKWLYHATLGGEHAVQDANGPRSWMNQEWSTLERAKTTEQEITNLTPDGSIIRVNLRPYKDGGGDKEMLLWAFIFSAEKFKAEKSVFKKTWQTLGEQLSKNSYGHITQKEWLRLDKETRAQDYPAIHHSKQYTEKYSPAYRVVLGKIWHN